MTELVNFQGLNCFYNSVLSIANFLGFDYERCFYDLWSEYDFRFDENKKIYDTTRIEKNLSAVGCEIKISRTDNKSDTDESISRIENGEYFVAGMDSYFVPWNDICGVRHGRHYFIAKKTDSDVLRCFDPTYGKTDLFLSKEDISAHSFETVRLFSRNGICANNPLQRTVYAGNIFLLREIIQETEELSNALPQAEQIISGFIEEAVSGNREACLRAASYTDVLISNRLLYKHYISFLNAQGRLTLDKAFMTSDYFLVWSAVKNGLYMLCAKGDGNKLSEKIRNYIRIQFKRETAFAKTLADALMIKVR